MDDQGMNSSYNERPGEWRSSRNLTSHNSVMWKLLTGIIADKLYESLDVECAIR